MKFDLISEYIGFHSVFIATYKIINLLSFPNPFQLIKFPEKITTEKL